MQMRLTKKELQELTRETAHHRQFLTCPSHKNNGMKPTEVCYFKCKRFNRCTAVKSAYQGG